MDEEKLIKETTDLMNGIDFLCQDQPTQIITLAFSRFWINYTKSAPPKDHLEITANFMGLIGISFLIDPEKIPKHVAIDEVYKLEKEIKILLKRLLEEQNKKYGKGGDEAV